jgi:hypothetical protein
LTATGPIKTRRRTTRRTATRVVTGLYAKGTANTPVTGLYVDAEISNVVDEPLHFEYVQDSQIRIRAADCGGTVYFQLLQKPGR